MFDLWETPLPVPKFSWKPHQFYVTVVVVVEIVTLSLDLCILGLCKTMFRALDHRPFYSLFSSIFTLKYVFEHLIFPRQVSGFPVFKRIELLELFLLDDPLVSGLLGTWSALTQCPFLKCLQDASQWLINSQNKSAQKSIFVLSL